MPTDDENPVISGADQAAWRFWTDLNRVLDKHPDARFKHGLVVQLTFDGIPARLIFGSNGVSFEMDGA